jgi:hypothetical protein
MPERSTAPRPERAPVPTQAGAFGPVDGPAPDGLEMLLQRASMPVEREPVPVMADRSHHDVIDRAMDIPSAVPTTTSPEASASDRAELADELYERIERRLRGELFRDLERRGHLSEWG